MHGEYRMGNSRERYTIETPPYARGILKIKEFYMKLYGNTPVCTGNTLAFQQVAL